MKDGAKSRHSDEELDQEEEKGCCTGNCDWKHWWPRLIVIAILIGLLALVIHHKSQVSEAM